MARRLDRAPEDSPDLQAELNESASVALVQCRRTTPQAGRGGRGYLRVYEKEFSAPYPTAGGEMAARGAQTFDARKHAIPGQENFGGRARHHHSGGFVSGPSGPSFAGFGDDGLGGDTASGREHYSGRPEWSYAPQTARPHPWTQASAGSASTRGLKHIVATQKSLPYNPSGVQGPGAVMRLQDNQTVSWM